jgi:hypothetical protein
MKNILARGAFFAVNHRHAAIHMFFDHRLS